MHRGVWAAGALAVALGACAVAGPSVPTAGALSRPSGTVRVARVHGVGAVLVDAAGHTVYVFSSDRRGRPTCTKACATVWRALVVRHRPRAGTGVKALLLGSVPVTGGRRQATYDHRPLYTYVGDTAAGEDRGQGLHTFGGTWSVIGPSGRALASTTPATGTAVPTSPPTTAPPVTTTTAPPQSPPVTAAQPPPAATTTTTTAPPPTTTTTTTLPTTPYGYNSG